MIPVPNQVDDAEDEALHAALRRVLTPLARLAIAKGIPHAALDEWLRAALVGEAYDAHPEVAPHRRVSRVSAATGLHRREVSRLLEQREVPVALARSLVSEVFAHWRASAEYRDVEGHPRALPRTGASPSFESLAQTITKDVHPRTLLDELLRLKLAVLDARNDLVTLSADGFVPRHDARRMAGFLGDNVGDHLDAAVTNLIEGGGRHLEQALFAHGLSDASIDAFKKLATAQWRALTESLVPALETLIERDDKADPSARRHRVRLGLFAFDEISPAPDAASASSQSMTAASRRVNTSIQRPVKAKKASVRTEAPSKRAAKTSPTRKHDGKDRS